ncbi:MAG: hypothetical protein ACJA2P_001124 [Rhodoferax sp.]|jgi:hypothetical protein
MTNSKKRPLRSAAWFGSADKNGFIYRSWMKNQGIPDHEFQGKPIIGTCNIWSENSVLRSGYPQLYIEQVLQADEGCDFDFLVGCRGAAAPRHSH